MSLAAVTRKTENITPLKGKMKVKKDHHYIEHIHIQTIQKSLSSDLIFKSSILT